MPIALAATADTSPLGVPRVRLGVTWTNTPVPTQVVVWRSDPSGDAGPIRQGNPVVLAAGVATVFDYEAAFGSTVTYSVSLTAGSPAGALTSFTVPDPGVPWLVHAGLPELSVALPLVTDWPGWQYAVPQGVFAVAGRRAPVVVTGRRQTGVGSLSLVTQSPDEDRRLQRILDDGTALLLKGSSADEPVNRWVAVGDVTDQPYRTPVGGQLRDLVEWTLQLRVVDAPSGTALAPVTYADSSLSFSSYADAATKAPTYAARSSGTWRTVI